jgi:deazaflavin-dependent oxidoreductase (nitroreductase family)
VSAWGQFADRQYCYLTTRGRRSGRAHRIEIWFAIEANTLYMLSGGGDRSDWVKNLRQRPAVTVELGPARFDGEARIVIDPTEDERARALVYGKYASNYAGNLTDWRDSALPIAVDLDRPESVERGG